MYQLSTLGALAALALLALLTLLVPLGLRRRARRARRHERLRVFTFANHKGGVGKTTSAFFVAQRLSRESAERKVLVVDCSIYGDLSRLLIGSSGDLSDSAAEAELIRGRKTCEDFGAAVLRARAGLLAFLRRAPDVRDHVHQVSTSCADAPSNLFLMTSRAQWLNGPNRQAAGAEEHTFELESNADVSAVAHALRASLASSGGDDSEWIVLIDTDGGLLHGMTKLALCAADSVVVPTNADTADVRRLHVMLRYMHALHVGGLTTGKIDLCFFNSLRVKANEPSAQMGGLGLPFSVADDVAEEMKKLAAYLAQLQAEFPHLLPALELEGGAAGGGAFFTGVRHGGVTLQRVKTKPYAAQLSDAVGGDFARLCTRIEQLAGARKLHY